MSIILCAKWDIDSISTIVHEVPVSDIKAFHERKYQDFETEVIMKNGYDTYLCKSPINVLMSTIEANDIMIFDNRVDNFVTYEESKLPADLSKVPKRIQCGKMLSQGSLSKPIYTISVRSIDGFAVYSYGGYKTEIHLTNCNNVFYSSLTIDEIMNLQGVNKNVKIYDPLQ